jgi:hypothetical protein
VADIAYPGQGGATWEMFAVYVNSMGESRVRALRRDEIVRRGTASNRSLTPRTPADTLLTFDGRRPALNLLSRPEV